ncbi:hypothetical protein [Haliea sp. E17]|uniref:hypothetical protein n=1 Tax=Haliea sp. E17 TaxID=3401576 RepID=UPI003AB0B82A
MTMRDNALPEGFESLAPFVEFWAVDCAAGRADCRQRSDEEGRQAFYAAASPLVATALDYLDSQQLSALDDSEQRLMKLVLSFAHLAMAVELHREEEPKHARDRHFLRITRAPADEPAACATAKEEPHAT